MPNSMARPLIVFGILESDCCITLQSCLTAQVNQSFELRWLLLFGEGFCRKDEYCEIRCERYGPGSMKKALCIHDEASFVYIDFFTSVSVEACVMPTKPKS